MDITLFILQDFMEIKIHSFVGKGQNSGCRRENGTRCIALLYEKQLSKSPDITN